MASSPDVRTRRIATIWLVAMTVVWGSTFFIAKRSFDAMAACPSVRPLDVYGSEWRGVADGHLILFRVSPFLAPVVFMLLRFVLSAIVFPIFVPSCVRQLSGRAARGAFWMSIACVAGCLFQIIGLGVTTPSMSAFLTSLAVLFTPLWVWIWRRKAPGARLLLAVAIAIVGLSLLTSPTVGRGWGLGETLNLACAACFAVQIVMIDHYMKDLPVAGTTWLMFLISGPMVACTLPFFRGWESIVRTPWLLEMARSRDVLWTLAYLVVMGSVVAVYFANRYQKDVDPTRAAVIYTLEPVFAAIFSFLFYGERFTGWMIAGAAILVAGNLIGDASMRKDAKLEVKPAES